LLALGAGMSFNLATILTETTLAAPDAPACRFATCPTRELEIIAYTRERLAAYKYPREIRFMDALPKGTSGKILKTALRDG
jgi:acyl-coenzyme A synthetase/AMP-(fatty) acid ligase